MPLLARFGLLTKDLYILDTSALFYNKENSENQYIMIDEPEINLHDAVKSYLMSKINESDLNIKEIKNTGSAKFEYMTEVIENMMHFVVNDDTFPLDIRRIKYTVLYHGDETDRKRIEEVYQVMAYNVPVFKNADFHYEKWYDFVNNTTEKKHDAIRR